MYIDQIIDIFFYQCTGERPCATDQPRKKRHNCAGDSLCRPPVVDLVRAHPINQLKWFRQGTSVLQLHRSLKIKSRVRHSAEAARSVPAVSTVIWCVVVTDMKTPTCRVLQNCFCLWCISMKPLHIRGFRQRVGPRPPHSGVIEDLSIFYSPNLLSRELIFGFALQDACCIAIDTISSPFGVFDRAAWSRL